MKKVMISNLELFWKKQVEALATRRPSWILLVSFVPVIFVVLRLLISFGAKHGSGIPSTATTPINGYGWPIWALYILVSAGLYGWMLVSEKTRGHSSQERWERVWLYSAFDMMSISFLSLVTLDTTFQVLETTKTFGPFLEITKRGILLLYVALSMLSLALTTLRLLRQPATQFRLPLEMKWAIAIPVFLMIVGIWGNSLLPEASSPAQVFLSAILLLLSYMLIPFWIGGVLYLVMLVLHQIPQNSQSDLQSADEQEIWIQEINGWLEPGEKIAGFTVGYINTGWSKINTVLVLTNKYIRIGSTKGGMNVPRQDVQKVEWSDLQSQIRVFTVASQKPLSLSVFGKKWKEHAKMLVESWE